MSSRELSPTLDRTGSISLQLCGAMELMGLNSQLKPALAVSRLQAPAMLRWQDSFALYKASERTGFSRT